MGGAPKIIKQDPSGNMKKFLERADDLITTKLKEAEDNPGKISNSKVRQYKIIKSIIDFGKKGKWIGKAPSYPSKVGGFKGWLRNLVKSSLISLKLAISSPAPGKGASEVEPKTVPAPWRRPGATRSPAGVSVKIAEPGEAPDSDDSTHSLIPPDVKRIAKIGNEFKGDERGIVDRGRVYGPVGSDPSREDERKYYGRVHKQVWEPPKQDGIGVSGPAAASVAKSATRSTPSPRIPGQRSPSRQPVRGTFPNAGRQPPRQVGGRPRLREEMEDSITNIDKIFLKELLQGLKEKIYNGKIKDKETVKRVLKKVIVEYKKNYNSDLSINKKVSDSRVSSTKKIY